MKHLIELPKKFALATIAITVLSGFTQKEIDQLRNATVVWMDVEAGAPYVQVQDPENGDPVELSNALLQLVRKGKLKPGIYALPSGTEFHLTKQHIALLRHANVHGMGIDPKRPFGDMSYFEIDMADILKIKFHRDAEGRPVFSREQQDKFDRLHNDLLPSLQIWLQNAKLTVEGDARSAGSLLHSPP